MLRVLSPANGRHILHSCPYGQLHKRQKQKQKENVCSFFAVTRIFISFILWLYSCVHQYATIPTCIPLSTLHASMSQYQLAYFFSTTCIHVFFLQRNGLCQSVARHRERERERESLVRAQIQPKNEANKGKMCLPFAGLYTLSIIGLAYWIQNRLLKKHHSKMTMTGKKQRKINIGLCYVTYSLLFAVIFPA